MRDRKRWGVVGGLALVVAVALTVVGVTTASGAKSAKKPIVIGWAYDNKCGASGLRRGSRGHGTRP